MLGLSTCAKCDGHNFEVVTQEPSGSNFKLIFVKCSICKAPIGVTEYYNAGAEFLRQKEQIEALSSHLSSIEIRLSNIEILLSQITNHLQR